MASYTLADKQALTALYELWQRIDALGVIFGPLYITGEPGVVPSIPYAVAESEASESTRHYPGLSTGATFVNIRRITITGYLLTEAGAKIAAAVFAALSPLPRDSLTLTGSFPATVTFLAMHLADDVTIEDTTVATATEDVPDGFWTVTALFDLSTTRVVPAIPT